MEDQKIGIQETKELVIGVIDVACLLIKNLKDGLQLGKDAEAVLSELSGNEALKAELVKAMEGISKVPAEVKDLDLVEGGDLAVTVASKVQDILKALQA